ncbi:MAG TPA: CADD family putative folate metabolism protein [Candidatus Kapabacteria bacterium]
MQHFFDRLDAAIQEYSLLKHPFYQAWSAGTLTNDTLRVYAGQYYQFEKRFPTFLSAVHANTESIAHRQQLLENLMEEERGEVNHPELWLRFADALGSGREEAQHAELFTETQNLIDTLRTITRNSVTLEGVAALYGYESQIPEISRTKIEGLTAHYNVTSDEGLSFFRVHEQADEVHRRAERDLIAELITSREDEDRAIAAAQRVAIAFYGMLDGIVRECNID